MTRTLMQLERSYVYVHVSADVCVYPRSCVQADREGKE